MASAGLLRTTPKCSSLGVEGLEELTQSLHSLGAERLES